MKRVIFTKDRGAFQERKKERKVVISTKGSSGTAGTTSIIPIKLALREFQRTAIFLSIIIASGFRAYVKPPESVSVCHLCTHIGSSERLKIIQKMAVFPTMSGISTYLRCKMATFKGKCGQVFPTWSIWVFTIQTWRLLLLTIQEHQTSRFCAAFSSWHLVGEHVTPEFRTTPTTLQPGAVITLVTNKRLSRGIRRGISSWWRSRQWSILSMTSWWFQPLWKY